MGGFCINKGAGVDESLSEYEESDWVARPNLRHNSDDRPCLLLPAFAVVSMIASRAPSSARDKGTLMPEATIETYTNT